MASKNLAKGLKRSSLAVALGLCFVGGVQAQSNTTGAIGGQAASGDTLAVTNPATGFSRTITAGADGSYRFSALPPGEYTITRNGEGARTVSVNVGTAANIDFVTAGGDATTLDTITVVGTGAINPIDVSSVESTTILTAEQIKAIPVAQNTTAVALLAPGTVRGDSAFGNLASFGGASVAENQYYVNGFNITNTFRNLNFAAIPFEAVAEQQIKTGGYGAEFGRSLGGVVNQITKRGTNEFHAGGNIYWEPESLREETKDTYYSNPFTSDFGTQRSDNSHDEDEQWRANLWASGALIQDRLFAYGLISYGREESDTYGSLLSNSNIHSESKNPNWLLKLDWNITDNHLLEFTGFSDKDKDYVDTYLNDQGSFVRTDFVGQQASETGGENYVLRYTGYLTDNFTMSALAGRSEFKRETYLIDPAGNKIFYDGNINNPVQAGCPVVVDVRPGYRQAVTGPYFSTCNISGGTLDRIDSGDERSQYRLDFEWILGDHRVRFGYDRDDYESTAGVGLEGGSQWRYSTRNPDGIDNNGDEFDIVRQQIFNQGAVVEVNQEAFYIEDSWSITDNFILYAGARWDSFENINGNGDAYVDIEHQFGPRLGFSWDVFGDSTFKVFGNAGRYALPLTPSVAVRGASASLFSREDFDFTMVDPVTGAPIDPVTRGNFRYLNSENGLAHIAETVAAKNLDPMYQDEYILGFQKQLTDHFSLGVRGIYRELKAAIDDNCDYSAVLNAPGSPFTFDPDIGFWVDAEGNYPGLPFINDQNTGFPYCRMFNPGEDAVFVTDFYGDGNLTTVTVPGELLSPPAKRTYTAVEFFFDASWENLFLQGNYTYAKSKGNTEGGVKSDIGQQDTNVTQDFDYLALTVDTYGYLPNDRRHSLKLFGSWDITDQWAVGANLLIQSGRPLNCFGTLDLDERLPEAPGTDPDGDGELGEANYAPHPYGSSFMRCSTTGNPLDDNSVVANPRGTKGRLPWTSQLDLNVAYRPAWLEGLKFQVDMFNVLNSQKVTAVDETAEDPSSGSADNLYLLPDSFQPARSVRFLVQYDF